MTATKKTTEVAYRIPGRGWKRKIVKSERALERLLDRLPADAEVRTREGGAQ